MQEIGKHSELFLNREIRRGKLFLGGFFVSFFGQIYIEENDTDFHYLIDGEREGKLELFLILGWFIPL